MDDVDHARRVHPEKSPREVLAIAHGDEDLAQVVPEIAHNQARERPEVLARTERRAGAEGVLPPGGAATQALEFEDGIEYR